MRSRARAALALLAALLGGGGCTAFQRNLGDPLPVDVLAVASRFSSETQGELQIRLALPNREAEPITARLVTWEAWLSGRLFAVGLQRLSEVVAPGEERVLYLSAPLAFRKVGLAPGPAWLDIGVRGVVVVALGTEEYPLPFARRMEVLSDGAPVFPAPGGPEE
jgi:hypothetical protein